MMNTETLLTVQFSLNYNTDEKPPQSVSVPKDKEMALAQKPIPERPGYRFAGWYKDPECTEEWLFGAKTPQFMQPPAGCSSQAVWPENHTARQRVAVPM